MVCFVLHFEFFILFFLSFLNYLSLFCISLHLICLIISVLTRGCGDVYCYSPSRLYLFVASDFYLVIFVCYEKRRWFVTLYLWMLILYILYLVEHLVLYVVSPHPRKLLLDSATRKEYYSKGHQKQLLIVHTKILFQKIGGNSVYLSAKILIISIISL